jgi:protein-S-isoprenylcysteine O-methyltransferase Ste14
MKIISVKIRRIPPPIVTLIVAALMYMVSISIPVQLSIPFKDEIILIVLVIALLLLLHSVFQFVKQKTTVNPLNPEKAKKLVVNGLYRLSRNPMYLGMALILAAWGVYLTNPINVFLLAGFILYMNRFQIKAEEAALEKLFGEEFLIYAQRVRRWI